MNIRTEKAQRICLGLNYNVQLHVLSVVKLTKLPGHADLYVDSGHILCDINIYIYIYIYIYITYVCGKL